MPEKLFECLTQKLFDPIDNKFIFYLIIDK